MPKRVSEKMRVRAGSRAFFHGASEMALAALELPALDVSAELLGEFDYLHLFATTQAALGATSPELARHLKPTGMFWVSWPKGRQLGTDLTLPEVIRIGYNHGLVESTSLSVDTTWSALKFTHPKPDKEYRNSYGQLPRQDP